MPLPNVPAGGFGVILGTQKPDSDSVVLIDAPGGVPQATLGDGTVVPLGGGGGAPFVGFVARTAPLVMSETINFGAPFTPSAALLLAAGAPGFAANNFSAGMISALGSQLAALNDVISGGWNLELAFAVLLSDGANRQLGQIISFDPGGFTINWTIQAAPTVSFRLAAMLWE